MSQRGEQFLTRGMHENLRYHGRCRVLLRRRSSLVGYSDLVCHCLSFLTSSPLRNDKGHCGCHGISGTVRTISIEREVGSLVRGYCTLQPLMEFASICDCVQSSGLYLTSTAVPTRAVLICSSVAFGW